MRRLAYTVHVEDPETGRTVVFLRGATPPKRVQKLITNPDVWEGEEEAPEPVEEAPPAAEAVPIQATEADGDEPPRAGKGSSKDAWVAFAAKHDVSVEDDAARDDIIAALVAAGKIKE
jgi:hypothetical protein